ncbi:hypothetical protein N7471_010577 [Penicillium samsonianum]|uniref:uncharacterized protein n=1 Tax=Penicillium samsonianum TaxID=1882272 RepID=UPI002546C352|nr:uncharacterized protein N7471_010577 [Penicillium samsonianum]KAJ6126084.1 hypothetical protein N7471_010577 [Penicillium samsonianum]
MGGGSGLASEKNTDDRRSTSVDPTDNLPTTKLVLSPTRCTHWSNSTRFLDPLALQKPASTLPRRRSPLGGALVSRVRAPSKSITQAGRVPRVTVYATTASAMV